MAIGEIYLGLSGYEILMYPYDRSFTIKRILISRDERTADGTLVQDVIAHKKQFVLSWETLDEDKIDELDSILNLDSELSLIVFTDATTYEVYTVLMQPFDKTRLLLLGSESGKSIWSGISITLDEV